MPTTRKSSRRPYGAAHVPVDTARARGGMQIESAADGEWSIRRVTSEKDYRCPGCNQTVTAGTPHLVTWRRDGWQGEDVGLELRRHWHSACWGRRR